MTPRAVIDTNVLVSAPLSDKGNPAAILDMASDGLLTPIYCQRILDEYAEVLSRPRFNFPRNIIDAALDTFKIHGIAIDPPQSVFPMPDEKDRVFYDTAVSGGATLITGNLKHYPGEPFIVSPAGFIAGL